MEIYKVSNDKGYTTGAWKGKLYNRDYTVNDITDIIRGFCKKAYPECKFSVSKRHHNAISIALMSAPYQVFATPDEANIPLGRHGTNEEIMKWWKYAIDKGHHTVNHYYIEDDFRLNDKGREIVRFLNNVCVAYNYDDSDSMVDYFDTNFYYDIAIGKWDKPFIIK